MPGSARTPSIPPTCADHHGGAERGCDVPGVRRRACGGGADRQRLGRAPGDRSAQRHGRASSAVRLALPRRRHSRRRDRRGTLRDRRVHRRSRPQGVGVGGPGRVDEQPAPAPVFSRVRGGRELLRTDARPRPAWTLRFSRSRPTTSASRSVSSGRSGSTGATFAPRGYVESARAQLLAGGAGRIAPNAIPVERHRPRRRPFPVAISVALACAVVCLLGLVGLEVSLGSVIDRAARDLVTAKGAPASPGVGR